jgi:general secretion pathway protein G
MQPGRRSPGLSNLQASYFRDGNQRRPHLGFQLLELLIAIAIISVLAVIAIPAYSNYRDKANNADAEADLYSISQAIERFYIETNSYPNSLADIRMGGLLDPWGHAYQYLRISGAKLKGKASLRKDKSLVPINTDFDLYSMGKDGATVAPLTAKASQDDIVRANNGKFIGLASDY